MNSTNVRVGAGNAPRTLALALGAWGGAVAAASWSGVFLRLPASVDGGLAAFAAAFALAAYALDGEVRGHVHRASPALLAAAAALGDVAVALALAAATGASAAGAAELLRWPFALLPYFVVPLALVGSLAAVRALAAGRLRSPAAKSPGGHPAAT